MSSSRSMSKPLALKPTRGKLARDPVFRMSRYLLYMSFFFSSLLVFRVGSLSIGDGLLLASAAAVIVTRLLTPRATWPAPYFAPWSTWVLFALLTVGSLLSVFRAALPMDSLAIVARLIVVAFVLPWIARSTLQTRRHLMVSLFWLAAGGALASAGTLVQLVAGPTAIPGANVTQAGRFTGFTGHVSDMGGVASLALAVGLGFLWTRGFRLAALIVLGVSTIGLVLSGSVSGFLTVAAALIVYLVRGSLKLRYVLLIGGLGVVLMVVASSILGAVGNALDPFQRLQQTLGLTEGGRYATSDIRAATYATALDQIGRSPFVGNGFDQISWIADGTFPAHNLVIGALFQGGLLTAAALVAVAVRPLLGRPLWGDRSLLTTQLIAGVVGAFTFAMTAPSLYNRYFWIPVALLGVVQAMASAESRSRATIGSGGFEQRTGIGDRVNAVQSPRDT